MNAEAVVEQIRGVAPGHFQLLSAEADGRPYAVICVVGVASGDQALTTAMRLQQALTPVIAPEGSTCFHDHDDPEKE